MQTSTARWCPVKEARELPSNTGGLGTSTRDCASIPNEQEEPRRPEEGRSGSNLLKHLGKRSTWRAAEVPERARRGNKDIV